MKISAFVEINLEIFEKINTDSWVTLNAENLQYRFFFFWPRTSTFGVLNNIFMRAVSQQGALKVREPPLSQILVVVENT